MFNRNWKKIKEAGLIRGAYHYFLATKSGKAQAENFINSVTLLPGDLPPVLDIEQTYGVPAGKIKAAGERMASNHSDLLWNRTHHLYECRFL